MASWNQNAGVKSVSPSPPEKIVLETNHQVHYTRYRDWKLVDVNKTVNNKKKSS